MCFSSNQLIHQGQICRDTTNDCDLAEYCTGDSGLCPPDIYMKNGSPCGHTHAENEPTGKSDYDKNIERKRIFNF